MIPPRRDVHVQREREREESSGMKLVWGSFRHGETQLGRSWGLQGPSQHILLAQAYIPCVTQALTLEATSGHLGLWLGRFLHNCGLHGEPFRRHMPDPYLCLKSRWSLPMPLPQLTHTRWEILS